MCFYGILGPFLCAQLTFRKFGCAKEFSFRRSALFETRHFATQTSYQPDTFPQQKKKNLFASDNMLPQNLCKIYILSQEILPPKHITTCTFCHPYNLPLFAKKHFTTQTFSNQEILLFRYYGWLTRILG